MRKLGYLMWLLPLLVVACEMSYESKPKVDTQSKGISLEQCDRVCDRHGVAVDRYVVDLGICECQEMPRREVTRIVSGPCHTSTPTPTTQILPTNTPGDCPKCCTWR